MPWGPRVGSWLVTTSVPTDTTLRITVRPCSTARGLLVGELVTEVAGLIPRRGHSRAGGGLTCPTGPRAR